MHAASRPTLSDATAGGVEDGAVTLATCAAVLDDCLTVIAVGCVATAALSSGLSTHRRLTRATSTAQTRC